MLTLRLMMKFGAKEHLEEMQKQGLIYCNPVKYFLKIEDGKLRGDEMEAVYKLQYMTNPNIQLREADKPDAPWLKLNTTNALFKESNPNPLGNIFCMSGFKIMATTEPSIYTIDKRCREFGGYFLLISDQNKFLKRVKKALDAFTFPYRQGLIKYLDLKTYSGDKTLFQKDLEYSYQEEFRIFLQTGSDSPFTLTIGSIEDISTLYDFEKVCTFHYKLPEGLVRK